MGRTVSNLYGVTADKDIMTLEIISQGLYQLEITFKTEHYAAIQKYRWCFDSGKGLVFTSDLTMELPKAMGYKTPRVYLRDYLPYLEGYWNKGKPSIVWTRKDLEDYIFNAKNTVEVLRKV